jgi:hypothetical protein
LLSAVSRTQSAEPRRGIRDKDAIYAGNGYAVWPQALSVKLLARLDRANLDLRIDGSDLRTCLHAQCAVETAVEARRYG